MSTTKREDLLSLEALREAAGCLKTMAHPCRLRMVEMLLAGEHPVRDLARACHIPSHMASEHLGVMRDRGLLKAERRGRSVYYSIAEEGLGNILECVRKRFGPQGRE